MKKITSLFILITMLPFVANAQIASKAYVDEQENMVVYGTTQPDANDVLIFEQGLDGSILDGLKTLGEDVKGLAARPSGFNMEDQARNAVLVTNSKGDVGFETGAFINNSKIESGANIELGKLHFPTPPAACSTRGCMLMFYDYKYVWEPVTRDEDENISTTGYVGSTPEYTESGSTRPVGVTNSSQTEWEEKTSHLCPTGYHWWDSRERCVQD